jgi:hypothetical protein
MVFAIVLAIFVAGLVVALFNSRGVGGSAQWSVAVMITVFLVLFVVIAIVRVVRRRKGGGKTSAEQAAERLDLTYQKKGERGFHQAFGPLPGIPRGGSVLHVVSGSLDGRLLNAFQHMYMIHTGQASVPIVHVVFVTEAPQWPAVTIAPRKGWTRFMDFILRRRRMLLEEDAFNAAFNVKTDDEDFALTLLHPEMQKFMTSHRAIAWQVNPGWAAMVYSGSMKFDRMEASLQRMREFWALLPGELEAW